MSLTPEAIAEEALKQKEPTWQQLWDANTRLSEQCDRAEARVRELEEAVRVLEYLQQHAFRDESTKKNVVVVRDLDLHSMTDTRLRNGITSFFTPIARAAVEGVNA